MRLARKLMLALTVAMLLVFSVRALVRVRYELEVAHDNQRQSHRLLGHALRPAVERLWRTTGREAALDYLRDVNGETESARLRIRWISLEPVAAPEERPRASLAEMSPVQRGEDLALLVPDPASDVPRLSTYVPLSQDGRLPGAIELSQSREVPREDLRRRLPEVLTNTALAALASVVVVSVLGFIVVIRPMRRLASKARRIGTGDLSGPVVLHQDDEIGDLAREINQMCERLEAAHDRIETEASAKIGAIEQLRHADRLSTVGKLASGIAHELGTPLNVVSGRAKMIARAEISGDAVPESARIIAEQADRMTKIIRQLLDFARRRGPQRAPCELLDLVRKTKVILRPLAHKRGVTLMAHASAQPAQVAVDGAQIQQALTNLLVNAIDAMPNGGTVTVTTGRRVATPPAGQSGPTGEFAFIEVADQGVGISSESLRHMFEPFFTTKGVGEGTGLGLSVAYGIVRDHSGWIDVQSRPGEGSCFTIYLPDEAVPT